MLDYVVSRFGMKYRNNDEDFHSWLSRRIRTIVVISLAACLSVSYLQASPEATNESQSLQAIIEAIKNTRPDYGTGRGIAHVHSGKNGAYPERTVVEFRFKDRCYRSDVFNVIDKQENELDFIYAVNTENSVKYIGDDGYVEASPGNWYLDFGTDFHPEVFNRWRGMSLDQILSSVLLVSKHVKEDISASIDTKGHLHFRAGGTIRTENTSRFSSLEVVIDTNEGFRLLSLLRQQKDYRGLGSKSKVRYNLEWEKYGTQWYIKSAEYKRNKIDVLDRMGNPIEPNESNEYTYVKITEFEPNAIIDDKEFTLNGLNLAAGTKIYDRITGITYKYGGPVDVPAMVVDGELPRLQAGEYQQNEKGVLFGKVLDEQKNPVANSRVFASYAHHDRTDANGEFTLLVPSIDNTGSLGPADFPLFVWSFRDNDPYRLAWTLIRHPEAADLEFRRKRLLSSTIRTGEEWEQIRQEMRQYPQVEETHQGVKLVIHDEHDLSQSIPGHPGELFEDDNDNPKVRNIVLVMGPANIIAGRVVDTASQSIANAVVQLEMLELQVGTNTITISELEDEWKAQAFAVTDTHGYYSLANLPVCWRKAHLIARADAHRISKQFIENTGQNTTCDFQLAQGRADEDHRQRPISPRTADAEKEEDSLLLQRKRPRPTDISLQDLSDRLVLYYSFGEIEGSRIIDLSGNGNHGEIHGTGFNEEEPTLRGMLFNGRDDYVSIPGIHLESLTFCALVKASDNHDLDNRRLFSLEGDKGYYALQTNSGGGMGYTGAVWNRRGEVNEHDWAFDSNAWIPIAVTYDGRTVGLYRDGELTEEGRILGDDIAGIAYIGGADRYQGRFWSGGIDEVMLFNCALTVREIEALHELMTTTPEPAKELLQSHLKGSGNQTSLDPPIEVMPLAVREDITLHYTFDDDPAEWIIDSSGRNNHARVHGAMHDKDGYLQSSLYFDGENDFLSTSNIHLENFTFSVFVKTLTAANKRNTNNRRLFLLYDGPRYYALQGNSAGSIGLDVTGHIAVEEYDWKFEANTWTHIAVTYAKPSVKLYRNGKLTEAGFVEVEGVKGTLYIGGTEKHYGRFWHGFIDEVLIHDRALSEEEIQQIYDETIHK